MITPFSEVEAASDWESYLCKVNDSIASIFVDLGFQHIAPVASHSTLSWLFIRLQQPTDDGLSRDEEFDALCRYEEDVELAISRHDTCLYVGRITTNGMRQFYFFITPDADFSAIIDEVLRKHRDYLYQVGQKPDASWGQYLHLLLPGENDWDQIRRRRAERDSSDA